MAPSPSPQRQVNGSCLSPRLFVMHHHARPSPRWKREGMGLEQSPAPQAAACRISDSSTATHWRQSLVKDSARFLWCYLRICHSLWEPGPARSDSSFGVLTPHVYVIEKRKNKFSCFICPQRLLAELGCALPWKGSRKKPLHTGSSSSSHETPSPSPALGHHYCPGHC